VRVLPQKLVVMDDIDTAAILDEMFSRITEIKSLGGIALCDVVDGAATVPVGWKLDAMTDYYVPAWWLCLSGGERAN
jgi:hypothetical protein